MSDEFKLDKSVHDRNYRRLESHLFEGTASVLQPKIVITGGQPGSGKSRIVELSREDFPDNNVVVINGDDLRAYHPQAKQILERDDTRYAEFTDPDTRVWTRKVFEKAIETKRNIIFESTMREPEPISATMRHLRKQGYHITIKVLAVDERTSATGIFVRYEEQKLRNGFGRFSPLSSHDEGYAGMPRTVQFIENSKLADSIEIYARAGHLLFKNDLVKKEWVRNPEAVKIIEIERRRPATLTEEKEFQDNWTRIFQLMDNRGAPLHQIKQAKTVHQKLETPNKQRSDTIKIKTNDKTVVYTKDSRSEELIMLHRKSKTGELLLPDEERKLLELWIDLKKEQLPSKNDEQKKRKPR